MDLLFLIGSLCLSAIVDQTYAQGTILTLSTSKQQEIVDKHNDLRRNVKPEASNMRRITWDSELAAIADSFVRKCNFIHSTSLSTSVFDAVGENLYSGSRYSYSYLMSKVPQDWYNEVNDFNFESNSCDAKKVCGHYTQVVWAKTYKIGCAVARCTTVNSGVAGFLFSCNYGPSGNVVLVYPNGTKEALFPYAQGSSCSSCGEDDVCENKLCKNAIRDGEVTTIAASTTTRPITTFAASPTTRPITTFAASPTTKSITTSSNQVATVANGKVSTISSYPSANSPTKTSTSMTASLNSTNGNGCPALANAKTIILLLLIFGFLSPI